MPYLAGAKFQVIPRHPNSYSHNCIRVAFVSHFRGRTELADGLTQRTCATSTGVVRGSWRPSAAVALVTARPLATV